MWRVTDDLARNADPINVRLFLATFYPRDIEAG